MTDLHDKALPDRLRDAASGSIEWRVQDKDRAYCMAFSSRDTINPERAAREWFSEHSKNYPENAAKYEVARCVVLDRSDRLMIEAADTIAALLAENEQLADALAAQVAATNGASAYAVQQANRAEAAEARLKALCEAEPVAWLYQHPVLGDNVQMEDQKPYGIWSKKSLIPRPSVEGGK